MADYSNVIKLDSFPSLEVDTGYRPAIRLESLHSLEIKAGGYQPAFTIEYFVDNRPKSGQINPRRL